MMLAMVPVILGRGRRRFDEGAGAAPLVSSEPVAGGTVILGYALG